MPWNVVPTDVCLAALRAACACAQVPWNVVDARYRASVRKEAGGGRGYERHYMDDPQSCMTSRTLIIEMWLSGLGCSAAGSFADFRREQAMPVHDG